MLSLLKKDLIVLTRQYKMYIVLLVFFLFSGSVNTSDEFFSTFPMVVCTWFTASLISYDERSRFDRTFAASSIARKKYVTEKYLFQIIVAGLSFAICLGGLKNRYSVGSPAYCNVLLTMLVTSLLVPSLALPIIFKNGRFKSFFKYMGVLIVGVAGCYYFSAAFEANWIAQISISACLLAAALLLIIFSLSFLLSVKYYEKREF